MLRRFFHKKTNGNNSDTVNKVVSQYKISKTGRELISEPTRIVLVRKIKRLFSITEEVWVNHYLFAIENFAELVQEVPASEIHHHSNSGGLIDHTLEALYAGIRISQGYVLPPNSEPEKITSSSDRWRFGAFIAILAHDLGKVVTDIEVVFRVGEGEFQQWHPWYGNLPIGSEYKYRYRKRLENSKAAKSLHEKAAMSLLPKILTEKAAKWIFEDGELLSQLFSTISHSTFGGHAIAEIVRTADSSSVSKNLGADTGIKREHSAVVPLHEKLIVSLRKLINDGELIKNRPGAALWVTDKDTWVVSKATMEAVRAQLTNEGHTGIPKNIVRLFEVLREHDLLIPNQNGESVWTAEINDFAKNWQQKLTFLRFKNEIIWPTSNPDLFDGEVTPIDKNGNQIQSESTNEPIGEPSMHIDRSVEIGMAKLEYFHQSAINEEQTKLVFSEKTKIEKKTTPNAEPIQMNLMEKPTDEGPRVTEKNHVDGMSSIDAKSIWKQTLRMREDILMQNEFIAWLLKGIERRQIRVNEAKAPVHILDGHIALVTPVIFNLYLDKNSLKKKIYEKRAGDKKVYALLQRELEALDIHQRGTNGQNIVRMSVDGQRSQSELKVYILNRDCFPSLSNFTSNKVMKILL